MRKIALLLPAALALAASVPAFADGRLVSQSVRGASRSCVYETLRTARPDPRGPSTRLRYVTVGRGEPCPATAPPLPAPPGPIPSMAMLRDQVREANAKVCVYTYLGRDYRRTVASTASCPLTPNF